MRTVLNQAAAGIDDRFEDEPLVVASIRLTLGRTSHAIGHYDIAGTRWHDHVDTEAMSSP